MSNMAIHDAVAAFEYDSRFVRLSEVVEQGHTRFRYDYDFGDNWEHFIEIEKTLPAEEGV